MAFHAAPGVVFAVAGPSIYRSTDGALSWTKVRSGVSIGMPRILVDPSNPSRVIVSGINALYRSDDAGLSFGAVSPPGSTSKLASSADGSALYAASGANDSKIFRSVDFGATWQERTTGLPAGNFVDDLAADPRDANTLYTLLQSGGLFKSTNAGAQWTLVNALSGLGAKKVAIDPGAPAQMLLATVNGGLQTSTNGGVTFTQDVTAPSVQYAWVGYAPSLPTQGVGAAVAIPYFGRVVRRTASGQSWVNGAQVKFVTVGDATFDPHNTDPVNSTLLIATDEGPLLSQDGGTTFGVRSQGIRAATPYNLAEGHDGQGTLYATYMSGPLGVHRRTALGWEPVNNTALRAVIPFAFQPLALAVDPLDAETLFVSTGANLVASFNGGLAWTMPNPDLGNRLARSIQFARSNPQVLYIGADPGGVYRSDNHGATWFSRSAGLPSIGVVAVDPASPSTVYAAAASPQAPPLVFKTMDGGTTWAPASTGLAVEWVVSLAIDSVNSQTVYAGGSGNGEGLFKSTDGGQSWARVGAPAGNDPGLSIAIDPVVPTTLVMSINALGGASRSVDGGATWEYLPQAPDGVFVLRTVVMDPLRPSNIIATADSYGLIELEVAPDLAVSLVAPPPASLSLGGSGSATIRVTNRGPFAASAVTLQLGLPAGTTAPVPTPTQGTCAQVGNVLECSLGPVRPNQQIDTAIALTAGSTPMQGMLTASVAAHESDPAPGDNSVSASVATARVADLGVALAANATAVDHHAPVTLTATATNAGPNASSAAQVVIDLGSGLTLQSATPSQGSCGQTGTSLTCLLGVIGPAAQATVAVSTTADGVGALTPSAQISEVGLQDPAAGNNLASSTVTSKSVADLAVQIVEVSDPVTSGRSLQYTATVTNNGPDDLTNATVTVNVAGATVASATTTQGSCATAGLTVSCTVGAFPRGSSATINIDSTAGPAGTASATANVSFSGTDATAANDSATQTTTVNAAPSGGGGGGGGDGPLELLALITLLVARGLVTRSRSSARRPGTHEQTDRRSLWAGIGYAKSGG